MKTEPRPNAIILAGPNGAGKSTLAPHLLVGELEVRTFVNADVIAQGLAGFDPASAAIQAGRIMLQRLDELRATGSDFAFETTLSGLWLRRTVSSLHASGYATRLVYVWVPDPEVSVARVRTRVLMGGHHVPDDDVRRRYYRSVRNFERVYRRMVTSWWVYDARRPIAAEAPLLIAHGSGDTIREIKDRDAWSRMQAQVADKRGGEK